LNRRSQPGFRFIEWGAVIAGAVMAAALSFVFLTFGTAIGLTTVSPWPNSGVSAKTAASLAIFWTLAQQIGAFMIGGYIAGRLRARWAEANEDETEFRDGLHGALVWAVGITIGAMLLFATAGAVARVGADVVGKDRDGSHQQRGHDCLLRRRNVTASGSSDDRSRGARRGHSGSR